MPLTAEALDHAFKPHRSFYLNVPHALNQHCSYSHSFGPDSNPIGRVGGRAERMGWKIVKNSLPSRMQLWSRKRAKRMREEGHSEQEEYLQPSCYYFSLESPLVYPQAGAPRDVMTAALHSVTKPR